MNRSTLLFTTEFYRYLSLRWLVLFFLIILGVSTAKADYDNWGSSGLQLSGEAVLSPDHNYVDFEVLMGEKSGQYDWIRAHVFVTYNNGQASERLGHMEMETFDIFDYVGKVEKINVNVDEDDLCRITFRYTPSSRILNLPNLDGIKIRGFWTQSDNCEYDIYNNTITNGSDYYTIEKKISISVGALNYPRGELYRPAPGKVAFKASGIPSYNKGNRRTKYNFCDDEKYNYFEQHILNPGETKIDHTITKRTYNNRDSYNIYILAISEDGDSRFDEKKGFVTVKGCSYAENAIANIQDENKWVPKVTISWDRCHTSSAYNVDGKWYIFRKEEGQNDSFYTNIGNVSFATSTYTDDNAEYNKKYVYCVSYYLNAWSTPDAPIRDLCSTTNTVSTFFNFPITLTTESGSNSITLRLQHPTFNNTNYTFKIFRKKNSENFFSELTSKSVVSNKTTEHTYIDNITDGSMCDVFQYLVTVSDVLGQDRSTPVVIGKISGGTTLSSFKASKGQYANSVRLSWTADVIGDKNNYVLLRRVAESTDPYENIYSISNSEKTFYYDDALIQPGVYYDYKLLVNIECSIDSVVENDSKTDIGFCQSSGTVSGRITYGTGTAVAGVKVSMKKNNIESDGQQYFSMGIARGGGLEWAPKDVASTRNKFESNNFSVQMYVRPDLNIKDTVSLLSVSDAFTLALRPCDSIGMYRVMAQYYDKTTKNLVDYQDFDSIFIRGNQYTHLSFVRTSTSLKVVVTDDDGDIHSSQIDIASSLSKNTDNAYRYFTIGRNQSESGFFCGYIDEIRIWTKALSDQEIINNYFHTLVGSESNLEVYYPLDEGLSSLVFDISRSGSSYHNNHAQVLAGATPSYLVLPSETQLGLSAITDSTGSYIIRGIPYSGEGTGYSLIPSMGIHSFSPTQQTRYISSTSLNHGSTDFTDNSSFEVSGFVYFENTNYPVKDVYLYMDGALCSREGKPIITDENGAYSISVPIGKHYITVSKTEHSFTNNGRFPEDRSGLGLLETFEKPISNLCFYDNTMVPITGRVVGGSIEQQKPYGLGQSKANIGKATITLSAGELYQLNTTDAIRVFDSPSTDVASKAYTGRYDHGSESKFITIHTDSVTGEFAALIPPIDLRITDIKVDNNPLIDFDESSFKNIVLSGINSTITDSVVLDNGSLKTFSYVYALDATYRSNPTLTVLDKGNNVGAFGESNYSYLDEVTGLTEDIALYKEQADSIVYTFGYPIFIQLKKYHFNIFAFENYYNYDGSALQPIEDKVPLSGTIVTISNELGAQQVASENGINNKTGDNVKMGDIVALSSNQVVLDDAGKAAYSFQATFPNIASPHTWNMNITYSNNGKIEQWSKNGLFKGIVFGDFPTGNNFTTTGPDKVLFILRDPPGSGSSAYIEKGTSFTYSENVSYTGTSTEEIKTISSLGVTSEVAFGVGVLTTTDVAAKFDLTVGLRIGGTGTDGTETTTTFVSTEKISTSSEDSYVGESGDIFIGSSTNYMFGSSRRVAPKLNKEKQFVVLVDNALTCSSSFGTSFKYSQNYIESYLIPNWKTIRDSLLRQVPASEYTTSYQNFTDKPIYITTLSPQNPLFGSANSDSRWGKLATTEEEAIGPSYIKILPLNRSSSQSYSDTILWINNQIKLWKDLLSYNEKMKVIAIEGSGKYNKEKADNAFRTLAENKKWNAQMAAKKESFTMRTDSIHELYNDGWLLENHSFDAGISYENSIQNETELKVGYSSTFQTLILGGLESGFSINDNGVLASISTETGYQNESSYSNDTTQSTTIGYSFQESGSDALSVDVFHAPDNFGPIFYTRAGQTSCPYEGEHKTRYYEPNKHILSKATMQIENPQIRVEKDYITDVPTGGAANYIISLDNLSDIQEDGWFQLSMLDESNPNGAAIYMDGSVLTNGRQILIRAGETTTKTLQLRQTRYDVLTYENIGIVVSSLCQSSEIADTIYISAQFIPSCSPINLQIDNRIHNTEAGDTLSLIVKDFDRNYAGFNGIQILYKGERDVQWNLAKEYLKKDINSPKLVFKFPINSILKFDQTYQFKAITVCDFGNGEINNESEIIDIVKDLSTPSVLGSPSPINGILTDNDEVYVVFNEPIKTGILSKANNFVVSGILNGHEVAHSVALKLQESVTSTEADIALNNTDFSVEMWLKYQQEGTIFSLGSSANRFKALIDNHQRLCIQIGDKQYVSSDFLKKDTWLYLSVVYQAQEEGGLLTAHYAWDDSTKTLFNDTEIAAFSGNGRLLIGEGMLGSLHELTLWNIARDFIVAQSEIYTSKYPSTQGLIGYWPLNEGNGIIASDKARNRHLTLPTNAWYFNNKNYATAFDGTQDLAINIAHCFATTNDDYAVECWFKGGVQGVRADLFNVRDTLLTIGFCADSLYFTASKNKYFLGTSYSDNEWHHLALNVLRNGSSIVYIDGIAIKQLPSTVVPALSNADIVLGKGFSGQIDEFRFWKATLTADVIRQHMYHRLRGNEDGLVAYYPFERTYVNSFQQTITEWSNLDQANNLGTEAQPTLNGKSGTSTEQAPALSEARSLENVDFDYTASDTKIVLSVTENAARIEGCTLEFLIKNVCDVNKNYCKPIKWIAYVSRNQLKWANESLNLTKEDLEKTTFTATISNNGSNTETWSLHSLPSWLSVNKQQGSLKPLSSETLSFTIAPETPIGKYEEVLYLSGNNNIDESFVLYLTVTGKQPDWSVNPANFELNMSVIGQLQIDGITSEDNQDIIAAFIDGKCVGVASPTYYNRYDAYFVLLDIYANTGDENKEVTFRFWDAGTGNVYPSIRTNSKLLFSNNSLIGSMKSPFLWNAEYKLEQSIDLNQGWNWTSMNVQPQDASISTLTASILPNFVQAKSKKAFSQKDQTGVLFGLLDSLHIGEMYKIKMNAASTLNIIGNNVSPNTTSISILPHWNWIGYTPTFNTSVADAFAGLDPENGDQVKGQSGFAIFDGYEWIGTLTSLSPGKGFMYQSNASAAKSFSYPSRSLVTTVSLRSANTVGQFTPVNENAYPGNMTMVAEVRNGEEKIGACEVGVFADEECRSAEFANENGLVFLTIAGESSGTPLCFKIYHNDVLTTVDQSLIYTDDASYGSLSNPYIIQLQPSSLKDLHSDEISIYPTQVVDHVVVKALGLISSLRVTDISGKVLFIEDKDANASGPIEYNIDFSMFSEGVYFILVETMDGKQRIEKVVK